MIDPRKLLSNRIALGIAFGVVVATGLAVYFLTWSIVAALVASGSLVLVFALWFPLELVLRTVQAKRRSRALKRALDEQPMFMPAAARETTAAELQRKFDEAVSTLRERLGTGFLHENPWFLLIGEIGSGKTTSLRRSGIRWPLGGEQQGIGGTINCDWWFANDAIILDTAGRFAVHEEGSPVEPVWASFLRQLAKVRPRKPIDGVVLAVPAEALIVGPNESRDKKIEAARRNGASLHAKLDELQRELGIVFPVHVLVTKCDRIHGFEEFFTLLPGEMHGSLFGWSNPHALDEPFRPEWLDEVFAQADEDLERIRLHLLERGEARADLIHLFPREFAALKPVLAAYLDQVFESSKYHESHLVRGIFFSSGRQDRATASSLIEYSPVVPSAPVEPTPLVPAAAEDPEGQMSMFLATPPKKASPAGASTPDDADRSFGRPYFVYDFYTKKVFRESGLARPTRRKEAAVTRLSRHAKAAAVVLALLGTLWLGFSLFRRYSAIEEVATAVAAVATKTPEGAPPVFADYSVDRGFDRPGNLLAEAYQALARNEERIGGLLSGDILERTYHALDGVFRAAATRHLDAADKNEPYYRRILGTATLLDFEAKLATVASAHDEIQRYAAEDHPVFEAASFLQRAGLENPSVKAPLDALTKGGMPHPLKLAPRAATEDAIRAEVASRWSAVSSASALLDAKVPGSGEPVFPEYQTLIERAEEFHRAWQTLGEKHARREVTALDVLTFAASHGKLLAVIPHPPEVKEAEETKPTTPIAAPPAIPGVKPLNPKVGAAARALAEGGQKLVGALLEETKEKGPDREAIALGLAGYWRGPKDRVVALFEAKPSFGPDLAADAENERIVAGLRDEASKRLAALGLELDQDESELRIRRAPPPLAKILAALRAYSDPSGLGLPSLEDTGFPSAALWRRILATRVPATRGERLITEPSELATTASAWYSTVTGRDGGARFHRSAGDFAALSKSLEQSVDFFALLGVQSDPAVQSDPVEPALVDVYRLAQEAGIAFSIARVAQGLAVAQEGSVRLEQPFRRLGELLARFHSRAEPPPPPPAGAPEGAAEAAASAAKRIALVRTYHRELGERGFRYVDLLLEEVRKTGVSDALTELAAVDVAVGSIRRNIDEAFLPRLQYDENAGRSFWDAPSLRRSVGQNTLWDRLYGEDGAARPALLIRNWMDGVRGYVDDGRERGEFVTSWGTAREKENESAISFRSWSSARDALAGLPSGAGAGGDSGENAQPPALAAIARIHDDLYALIASDDVRSFGVELAPLLDDLVRRAAQWDVDSASVPPGFFERARNRLAHRVADEVRLFLAHKLVEDTTAFVDRFREFSDRFPFRGGAEGLSATGARLEDVWAFFASRELAVVALGEKIPIPGAASRDGRFSHADLVSLSSPVLGGAGDDYYAVLRKLGDHLGKIHAFLIGSAGGAASGATREEREKGFQKFQEAALTYSLFFRATSELGLDEVAKKLLDYRWIPPAEADVVEICGFSAASQSRAFEKDVRFQWNDTRKVIELWLATREPNGSELAFLDEERPELGRWVTDTPGRGDFCAGRPLAQTLTARLAFRGSDEWYLFRLIRAFGDDVEKDQSRGRADQWPSGHTLRFPIRISISGEEKPFRGELDVVLRFKGSRDGLSPRFDGAPIPDPTAESSWWRTDVLARRARSR